MSSEPNRRLQNGALEVAMLGPDQGLVQEIFVAMSRASGERS